MKRSKLLQPITTRWQALWEGLLNFLETGGEPHVWQTHEQGQTCWHAYDPLTGNHTDVGSEADLREWLEERYYAH